MKTKDIVLEALTSGACKHVDSAPVYQNQKDIGEAIEAFVTDAGGKRDEIHVTSKLMTYSLPPEEFEEETKRRMNIKPDKAQDPRPIVTITGAIMPEENTWKFPRSVSSKTKLAIEGPKTESNNTLGKYFSLFWIIYFLITN